MDKELLERISASLTMAEHRLSNLPWKDWPPDRVKDLVKDLRLLFDHVRGRPVAGGCQTCKEEVPS